MIERLQLRVPLGELSLPLAQRPRALIHHLFELQRAGTQARLAEPERCQDERT
jgi:hypothetical protein